MKIINKITGLALCSLALIGMPSCKPDKFLDKKPLDQVGPGEFYNQASQLGSFTINYYNSILPHHAGWGIGMGNYDNGTDNQAAPDPYRAMFAKDYWRVPTEGGIGFNAIRNFNWFITNAEQRLKDGKIAGPKSEIDQYIGEAYFLRGLLYFNKLVAYGDYPIETVPLEDKEEELIEAEKRMPRNEVARFILSDMDEAIKRLPDNTALNQRISKKVAYLIKSRVALFEATFEKYHKGSGRVPGDANWPGKDKEWNKGKTFNIDAEVDFFLTEAMTAAKKCADMVSFTTQNTHKMNPDITAEVNAKEGWNPYFEMFSDRNMSKYPEILLWKQYSLEKNHVHITSHYLRRGTSSGWTRSLINSFLTKDGLPIYADPTNYAGDATIKDVKKNRDERLQLFIWSEDNLLPKTSFAEFGTYNCPHFLNNRETKDVTGYAQRKYYNYLPSEDSEQMTAQAGAPIYRVAEAYLNYIEACYEKTGAIDATAMGYWQALRRRAGVSIEIQKTINATDMSIEANTSTASYDWGAFSAGKPVDATLYSIRRERRSEFAGEGYRMDDLKRWRAMDQVKNYQIEGVNFWTEIYKYPYFTNDDGKYMVVSDGSAQSNISAKSLTKYMRPYQVVKVNNDMYDGYTFYQAHYLSPFSYKEMQLASPDGTAENSNLYQNPGWPVEANGVAEY